VCECMNMREEGEGRGGRKEWERGGDANAGEEGGDRWSI
jgi:hypothetical protein